MIELKDIHKSFGEREVLCAAWQDPHRDGAARMTGLPALDVEFLGVQKVIAIIRAQTTQYLAASARSLVGSGVTVLEFPLTTPGVLDVIGSVAEELAESAHVGAGSVTTLENAREAHGAGAKFLVTPNVVPAVIEYARNAGLPIFAGAFSPSEIHDAWTAGATAVKLFPASLGGPDYVRELIRGPYPDIPLIPTGGVDIAAVPDYLDAGALALGMGSALLGSAPDGGSVDELHLRVREFTSMARR
jgi:2-dehydro-3-deoxyphosphogluconate aldolase / (4S)-4-hydroxy-2-oxoglutarate aldolase